MRTLTRNTLVLVSTLVLGLGMILGFSLSNPIKAGACTATTTIGVGGFGNGNATVFPPGSVDLRVQYSGALNDMQGGINALQGLVNQVRRDCPGTKITLAGHSQGAAIVHVYLTRFGLSNGNAVLYADPKLHPTGESGFSFNLGGYPIGGTDDWFSGVPTVSICFNNDVICNRGAGWFGYLFQGAHSNYDFQPRWHAGQTGVIRY